MNLLISSNMDSYWNLATEEYLLKNSQEDFIFLYVNKPSVVVGKHQIAQKEVNSKFINDNNILVARRLSGGGAVYHDEGNLNISFIQTGKPGENISYKKITEIFYHFLNTQAPELGLNERNDFVVNGKKVSGSAMHIFKSRILAHCTLLVECNLTNLSSALKGHPDRFTDKSISSKRSEVMNLSENSPSVSIEKLIIDFVTHMKENYAEPTVYELNSIDNEKIQNLATTKYSNINWIYGYSPRYIYRNSISFRNAIFHYVLEIDKGIIESVSLDLTHSINTKIELKLNELRGMQHNPQLQIELKNAKDFSEIDEIIVSSLL
ncbi:MAG: lipoate--protein ligase [Prolixibacteraceae bacterium]